MSPTNRPLDDDERRSLDFLLTDDIPDVEALRAQARGAAVSGECDCGCATIDLTVDPDAPLWTPTPAPDRIVAHAWSRTRALPLELLLHAVDGRLAELEIVDQAGDFSHARFPPPSTWQAPIPGPGSDEDIDPWAEES